MKKKGPHLHQRLFWWFYVQKNPNRKSLPKLQPSNISTHWTSSLNPEEREGWPIDRQAQLRFLPPRWEFPGTDPWENPLFFIGKKNPTRIL